MRLLLAIDDSKFSEAATQAVIAQCQPQGMEVKVLNVVDLAIPIPTSYAGAFRKESLKHGQEIVQRAERLLSKAGYKTQTAVEEGDPKVQDHRSSRGVEGGVDCNGIAWTERGRPIFYGQRRRSGLAPCSLFGRDRTHT